MACSLPSLLILCVFTVALAPAVPSGGAAGGDAASPAPGGAPAPRAGAAPSGSAGGQQADSAGPAEAAAILQAAIERLEGHQTVSAKVRQQIDLFDRQLVGSGEYFQQRAGKGHLIRLELRIPVGDQVSSLLQVLSAPTPRGHYLWTCCKLPSQEKLSRIDVARAGRALERASGLPGSAGEGMMPALGGVPRLLRGLQGAFELKSAERGRFDGLPVWRLEGELKGDRLAKTIEELPNGVVLILGQDDLFPYRIEYRRGTGETGTPRADSRALLTMELFDVKLDEPIDRSRFVYHPGNSEYTDETESFIRSLRAGQ